MVDFRLINNENRAAREAWAKFATERGYDVNNGELLDVFRNGWMARARAAQNRSKKRV